MDMYNYHADDLEEDEIDYELGIRGIVSDENMESKRRELRLLINDDRKNPKLYTTTVTLEQEAEWIAGRIRSIQDELKRKISLKAQSRLISLRNRVLRAPSSDALTKNTFVALIDAIGSTYFSANPNQNAVLSSETRVREFRITHEHNHNRPRWILARPHIIRTHLINQNRR